VFLVNSAVNVGAGAYTNPSEFNPNLVPFNVQYDYKLYDIAYETVTIRDWRMTPPDQAAASNFWQDSESFRAEQFSQNARAVSQLHTPFAIIPIASIIFLTILFFIIAMATRGDTLYHILADMSSSTLAVAYVEAFVFVAVEALLMLYLPDIFMRFGMFIVLGLCLIGTIVAMVYGAYGAIGFFLFIAIFAAFYYFMMMKGAAFSAIMLQYLHQMFVAWPCLLALGIAILAIGILGIFGSYLPLVTGDVGWFPLIAIFSIGSSWYTIQVFGQVIYQLLAQFVSLKYFTGSSNYPYFAWVFRACYYNLGISAFNAFFLPLLFPIYAIAKVDPIEVRANTKFLPDKASRLLSNIFHPIHNLAVTICRKLDKSLDYPSQRGAVYSAMFGISRADGCRRVAEIDSKFYADVMNVNCYIDYLLGFVGLVLEITAALTTWVTAGKLVNAEILGLTLKLRQIGGGLGFFMVYGFVHILRMAVGSIIDTTFICFFELPEGMGNRSQDAAARIPQEYEEGVQRKRGVTSEKQAMDLLNRETY
jgi:hypothetical protein